MADIVYMVRHAAPPADKRGRYWGASDPGVDADGLDAVNGVARLAWVKPEALFTSPLARAAATAEPLGAAFGLEARTLPELAEVDFGAFEGLDFAEVEQRYPDAARQWTELGDGFAFPGGEAIGDFFARAGNAFAVCTERPEEAVMCVTHGGIIAAWCCLFLRMPLAHRFAFRPEYAALTAFIRKKDGSGWEMAFFNNKV